MPLTDSGASLFAGSVEEFVAMAPASSLTAHLEREFNTRRWGFGPASASEVRSWRNSLTALAAVIRESGIDTAGVGVELRLPATSKRVDASFVARDDTGKPHVALVELKQWDSVAMSPHPETVQVGGQSRLHPSVQAGDYAAFLRASHSAFTEDGFELSACAYLHNLAPDDAHAIRSVAFAAAISDAPFFTMGEDEQLAGFLRQRLSGGGGMGLLPSLIHGRYRPNWTLFDGIRHALNGRPVWRLLDEQKVAYNVVAGSVAQARLGGGKAVVIVRGGPGTGKSVIAAHLVAELGGKKLVVSHVTGSKAFTTNLHAVCPRGARAFFGYTSGFDPQKTRPDSYDVVVCDEAHRLRETTTFRFQKRGAARRESQAREIMRAAKVSVFFLDERQNVRPGEIGSPDAIRADAATVGVPVHEVQLTGQFRCNGCLGYMEYIDRLMSASPEPPAGWLARKEYDFRLFGSPEQMEAALLEEAERGRTARLLAGFCWPWSEPNKDGSLVADVQIGGWRRPWNEKAGESRSPTRDPYYLWATQPERIGEVGCIYSAQGFEFDYAGVILGPDLVWRPGAGWVACPEASFDSKITKSLERGYLLDLMFHTYRVLLTRGVKGTFLYATDPDTRLFLTQLLSRQDR